MMSDKALGGDAFDVGATASGFRSGFIAIVGRPNVGKSTLLNKMVAKKVTIVSDKAQTTRHQIRAVLTRPDVQLVFVDTPGSSKPRSALGQRLNETAELAGNDVDVVCLVIDGHSGFGPGDRFLATRYSPENTVVVLNKIDGQDPAHIMNQLAKLGELGFSAYFPVSAFTGRGVTALVDHLAGLMPPGPYWYPQDMVTDRDEAFRVAELVREQLLHLTHEELPHSITTRVLEWEWPRIRVEILVARNSQKGIVIGKGGSLLKAVGTRVRRQLPDGAFLELIVNVDKNWNDDPASLRRLGY